MTEKEKVRKKDLQFKMLCAIIIRLQEIRV